MHNFGHFAILEISRTFFISQRYCDILFIQQFKQQLTKDNTEFNTYGDFWTDIIYTCELSMNFCQCAWISITIFDLT